MCAGSLWLALGATTAVGEEPRPDSSPPSAREAAVSDLERKAEAERRSCCFGLQVPELRFRNFDVEWRAGVWATIDGIIGDPRDDSFGVTDLRPTVEGRWRQFSFRVEADAMGVDTPRNLYEAWAGVEFAPWLRVTGGQVRVALGSEFATHESRLPWVGYSFPAYLDGRHDVGVRIDGAIGEWLWYQAAAVAGHGFDLEGHRRESPQLSLRGVIHPARVFGSSEQGICGALRGFHAGLGIAELTDGDDPVHISTPLQSQIFDTPDLDGDSGQWVHVELGYVCGPFQLGYERTVGSIDDVPIPGDTANMDQLTGFSVGAALNLTGERRGWQGGAFVPATEPRRAGGGLLPWLPDGRWEIAARHSNADIDRDLFDLGYATYDVSSQETRTFSLAVSWEPCERARLAFEWVKTIPDSELSSLDGRNRDSSFVLRLEIRF
jgi:hypothetical protein